MDEVNYLKGNIGNHCIIEVKIRDTKLEKNVIYRELALLPVRTP